VANVLGSIASISAREEERGQKVERGWQRESEEEPKERREIRKERESVSVEAVGV
jgi:hypothetical protein